MDLGWGTKMHLDSWHIGNIHKYEMMNGDFGITICIM